MTEANLLNLSTIYFFSIYVNIYFPPKNCFPIRFSDRTNFLSDSARQTFELLWTSTLIFFFQHSAGAYKISRNRCNTSRRKRLHGTTDFLSCSPSKAGFFTNTSQRCLNECCFNNKHSIGRKIYYDLCCVPRQLENSTATRAVGLLKPQK